MHASTCQPASMMVCVDPPLHLFPAPVQVNVLKGQQRDPQFLAINPVGKIPAISEAMTGALVWQGYWRKWLGRCLACIAAGYPAASSVGPQPPCPRSPTGATLPTPLPTHHHHHLARTHPACSRLQRRPRRAKGL